MPRFSRRRGTWIVRPRRVETVLEHLKTRSFDPRDYGAIGDGVANDRVALDETFTDANDFFTLTGSRPVVDLNGLTYFVGASAAILKSGVTYQNGKIVSSGDTQYGALTTGTPGVLSTSKTLHSAIVLRNIIVHAEGGPNMRLRNITGLFLDNVECTGLTIGSLYQAMWIEHCAVVAIRRPYIHDVPGNGLSVHGSDYVAISDPQILNTGDDAIDIDIDFLHTALVKSRFVTLNGGEVDTVRAGNALRIESSDHCAAHTTVLKGASAAGAIVNSAGPTLSCESAVLNGLDISDCPGQGIYIQKEGTQDVKDTVVSNNDITNCGNGSGGGAIYGGIVYGGTSGDHVASGNRIKSCGNNAGGDGGGVVLYRSHNVTVEGGRITDCPNIAFNVWNGDAATTYTGCVAQGITFRNNGTNFGGGGQDQAGFLRLRNPGDTHPGTSSISVTASPFTYTAGNRPEAVYIRSGTVSDISKNGRTIFIASPATVILEPGEQVTVTYSVAPTMEKDRK